MIESLLDRGQCRRLVRDRGVKPLITGRRTDDGSGFRAQRRVVERAFAPLHGFRRLRIRWERRHDIREAFLALGHALIRWRRLRSICDWSRGEEEEGSAGAC